MEDLNIRARFIAAYAAIAVVGICGVIAFFVLMFAIPKHTASKTDLRTAAEKIRAELGPTTEDGLKKEAQKTVAQAAAAQGVTLIEDKVVKVTHPDALTVYVYIKAKTAEYGTIRLRVPFKKGIYAVGAIEQA